MISSFRRNPPFCVPANIKGTHYLNNILARLEANKVGVAQAVMLDFRGFVAEVTGGNIFMAKNGILATSPISASILEGTTRRLVMEIAEELCIPCQERDIVPSELYMADEVFVTSTGLWVNPLVKIDGRKIGDGKPGPIETKIDARFRELVQTTGTSIYT
jgi:branched-chain amino acid aminotransferase